MTDDIQLDRALQALQAEQNQEAFDIAQRIIKKDVSHPLAWLITGVAQAHLHHIAAVATLAHAVSLAPLDPQFHYNYAVTLAEYGQEELAMVEYRRCLDLEPNFSNALWNYSELLRLRSHFAAALACLDHLLALEQTMRDRMAHRMAVCCSHLGDHQRADDLFDQQLALLSAPHDALTHWEYALHLLGCGKTTQAWTHYAHRFTTGQQISVSKPHHPYPRWQGETPAGATLLVHGEQGAGDEMLFAAFIPSLMASTGAKMQVVLACKAPLVRLLQASFKAATVLPDDSPALASLPAATWQIALGDLPLYIPQPKVRPYLQPHPDDQALMHAVIQQIMTQSPTGTLKVGLVWSANPQVSQINRQSRNVPPALLNGWLSPLNQRILGQRAHPSELAPIQFFSLQTSEHRPAMAHLADLPILDMSEYLTDFSRTAALMLQMDVVVSVCTSTANLSGALGLPTWVLLQRHADWRWHTNTTATATDNGNAWYADITCFQQHLTGDWSVPLNNLVQALSQRSASHRLITLPTLESLE